MNVGACEILLNMDAAEDAIKTIAYVASIAPEETKRFMADTEVEGMFEFSGVLETNGRFAIVCGPSAKMRQFLQTYCGIH